MSDVSHVLVDTNILVDITGAASEWSPWSRQKLVESQGGLLINPIIFSEMCVPLLSLEEAEGLVAMLGLTYLDLPKEALFLAARAFTQYRRQGGAKISPLPDFYIGAHAAVLGVPILTRDGRRYQSYFPTVRLISP